MSQIKFDDNDQCPICRAPLQLLRISSAARAVDVSPKTIYRYVEKGDVFAVKVAGKTLRVCKTCLLKPYSHQ